MKLLRTFGFDKNFVNAMETLELEDKGVEMLRIENFSNEQLDPTNFFTEFMSHNAIIADISADASSNVSGKSINTMMSEAFKPMNKLISFHKMFIDYEEKYGVEEATKWLHESIYGGIYNHDANTMSLLAYCFAFSMEIVANKGLFWMGTKSGPAKHADTFNLHTLEFISTASNNLSGAVGLPDVLLYMYYFFQQDVKTGYIAKGHEDRAKKQLWQSFIFNLNQDYVRDGIQTAYTNISVFDREYFLGMFGDKQFPDGSYMAEHIEEFIQYQKEFIVFSNELKREVFYTFPVITASLIFKDDKPSDDDFFRYVADKNREFGNMNIYLSNTADNLSSCCFDRSTEFLTSDGDIVSFEDYKDGDEVIVPTHRSEAKKAKVKYFGKQDLNKVVFARQGQFNVVYNIVYTSVKYVTANHRWILSDGSETNNLRVGDKLFIKENGYKWRVESIEPYKKNQDVWCLVVEDDESFILKDEIVCGNCRLKNDVSLLDGHFNSIGGSSLSIGSVKVITLNLVRCALEADTVEGFFDNIRDKSKTIYQALDIQRNIIKKNIAKGLYPLYSNGLMELRNQYSTIGINGIYEAIKQFGGISEDETGFFYNEKGKEIALKIMKEIDKNNKEFVKDKDYTINMEQVPFESGAIKNCKKDRLLYEDKMIEKGLDLTIYGNQWIPLNVECTLFHRLEMSALLDNEASGGAILHRNRAFKVTAEQNYNDMCAMAKMGIVYYSDVIKQYICEDDHTNVTNSEVCPICGKPIVDVSVKIVGYSTRSKNYQKQRKEELEKRVFYKGGK